MGELFPAREQIGKARGFYTKNWESWGIFGDLNFVQLLFLSVNVNVTVSKKIFLEQRYWKMEKEITI